MAIKNHVARNSISIFSISEDAFYHGNRILSRKKGIHMPIIKEACWSINLKRRIPWAYSMLYRGDKE
jgi:hypothetical protein